MAVTFLPPSPSFSTPKLKKWGTVSKLECILIPYLEGSPDILTPPPTEKYSSLVNEELKVGGVIYHGRGNSTPPPFLTKF